MTNTTNMVTRRALVFGYLDQLKEERLPLKKFLKANKMIRQTFYKFEAEYKVEKKALDKRGEEEHFEQLRATMLDAADRVEGREPPKRTEKGCEIKEVSNEERLALARKAYDDAMRKGATKGEKELAMRMLGLFIEKSEGDKDGLSADEITRRNLEADRQLRDSGY